MSFQVKNIKLHKVIRVLCAFFKKLVKIQYDNFLFLIITSNFYAENALNKRTSYNMNLSFGGSRK